MDDDDDKRLRVNTGKQLTLKRPEIDLRASAVPQPGPRLLHSFKTKPDGSAFFDKTEEERAAIMKRVTNPEPAPPPIHEERKPRRKRSIPYPDPDLIRWCENYMRRMKSSRTAMEIVDGWYATWRRHRNKPKNVTPKHKAGHVDRVTKWLERHERQGRLRIAERRGKWNAKSYLQVAGADWRRPRKLRDEISPNVLHVTI